MNSAVDGGQYAMFRRNSIGVKRQHTIQVDQRRSNMDAVISNSSLAIFLLRNYGNRSSIPRSRFFNDRLSWFEN